MQWRQDRKRVRQLFKDGKNPYFYRKRVAKKGSVKDQQVKPFADAVAEPAGSSAVNNSAVIP